MKFSLFLIFSILALCCVSITSPVLVYAQGSGDPKGFTDGLDKIKTIADDNNLNSGQSSKEILQTIIAWITSLMATFALISLLYGAYLYITSQGDENNVEKAKMLILYSIIGIIIIGLSAVIVNVVIGVATQ